MKKTMRTIGIIAGIGIMLIGAYLFGTIQSKTITEVQTVTETREVISDRYIPLDDCIVDMDTVIDYVITEDGLQLYFNDGTGYWFERQKGD